MSVTVVQPYCQCYRQDCTLRNKESAGVCAITLPVTDSEWSALLKKYDQSIFVTSPDCPTPIDPGFVLVENCGKYLVYGPAELLAKAKPAITPTTTV